MAYIIFNGNVLDNSQPYLDASNRAFKFGDAGFESIRVVNGGTHNLEAHIQRLAEYLKVTRISTPDYFSAEYFRQQIKKLCELNQIQLGGRVRLTVFRNGSGNYSPTDNTASFVLTAIKLENNLFKLNHEGITVDLYTEMKKNQTVLSPYKSGNSMLYVMAGLHAKDKQWDDCLLVNDKNSVIEASNSNIFLVSNRVLYTPPITDGCVAGTMRMKIINLALTNNIKVYESSITPQHLLMADELFLTNSIQGIRWIGAYKSKRFFNNISNELVRILNESASNLKLDFQESSIS
ncbi:MAG: aminotransferase class IV [Flavobacteriales bacterium]